jgi:ribose 5-phosphate isomerase B
MSTGRMKRMTGRVIIGNDHGAVELKNRLVSFLTEKGLTVDNLGVDTEESVDYPDIAEKVCHQFLEDGNYDFGIICCGTGIGISISANKIPGIRCALPQNIFASQMAKAHNDANFIAFGGRIEYPEPPEEMLSAFIDTDFEGGRHQRRVDRL